MSSTAFGWLGPIIRIAYWDHAPGRLPVPPTIRVSPSALRRGLERCVPAGQAPQRPAASQPRVVCLSKRFHIMPARSPSVPAADAVCIVPAPKPVIATRSGCGRPSKQTTVAPIRRTAAPFDAEDNGANCLRCGYAIEPAREQRGLMTWESCRWGGSESSNSFRLAAKHSSWIRTS